MKKSLIIVLTFLLLVGSTSSVMAMTTQTEEQGPLQDLFYEMWNIELLVHSSGSQETIDPTKRSFVVATIVLFEKIPLLFIFGLLTMGLFYLRSKLYGYKFYRPFLWNLFLAWIPLVAAMLFYITTHSSGELSHILHWLMIIVWFFFFPNASYLLTEVHHFRDDWKRHPDVPLWFDTVAILSLIVNGLLLAIFSLNIIQFSLDYYFSTAVTWSIIIFYLLLSNAGIYIGRYLRFNSWDVLTRPWMIVIYFKKEINTWPKFRDFALYVLMFTFIILFVYFFVHGSLINVSDLASNILST